MNPILASALAAARSRRRRGRPRRPGEHTLVRLLAEEVVWAVRASWHPVTYLVAVAAAVGVGAVLGPNTPGPVLGAGWRLGVAVGLGMVSLSVVHAMLRRPREASADDLAYLVRMGMAVLAAVVVATAMLRVRLLIGGPRR